ncbi:hypothetical protein O181_051785 [Austropuccinia psidii MF-1]|uniref:Uncharacterized protein n=1 Tax=Austropuccinia psidii MF-1 TaxID=1389203 RepID=A0A9Q3DXR2_9BASI|nr:hypothetical protein [Austropuccinia psidii MF-1]
MGENRMKARHEALRQIRYFIGHCKRKISKNSSASEKDISRLRNGILYDVSEISAMQNIKQTSKSAKTRPRPRIKAQAESLPLLSTTTCRIQNAVLGRSLGQRAWALNAKAAKFYEELEWHFAM